MRTSRFRSQIDGHRVGADANRDVSNKLGYQQLLTLNHDLSRENIHLKNISNRLGAELKRLHSQFDIRPQEENVQLYNAINAHPILNRLENTLLPLIDTYEKKIQEFQAGFETIQQEFLNLERRYEDVVKQNDHLRTSLTDKITEIIELYRVGVSEKLGGDFAQMMMQQIKEKQRLLADQNSQLEAQNRKIKAEGEKVAKELVDCKRRLQQNNGKVHSLENIKDQLTKQNKFLKEEVFSLQAKNSVLQNEGKQLSCELQRAQAQVSFLNKQQQGYLKNIQRLKQFCEQKENIPSTSFHSQSRSALMDPSKSKNNLVHQVSSEEDHKKLLKIQKQLDQVTKERNKMKEQIQRARIPLDQANERLSELRKRINQLEDQKATLETNQLRSRKKCQQLLQKSKNDLQEQKNHYSNIIEEVKSEYEQIIKDKNDKISSQRDQFENLQIQCNQLKQDAKRSSQAEKDVKAIKDKQMERKIQVVKQEKDLVQQICKQKVNIVQHQLNKIKKQSEQLKEDSKLRQDELKSLKIQLQKTRKDYDTIKQEDTFLKEEITRLRGIYETTLKQKQRQFDQKLKQIKTVVEQSERRRKQDKADVEKAARQYKRILQEIRNAYQERIRIMESQLLSNSNNRRYDR